MGPEGFEARLSSGLTDVGFAFGSSLHNNRNAWARRDLNPRPPAVFEHCHIRPALDQAKLRAPFGKGRTGCLYMFRCLP